MKHWSAYAFHTVERHIQLQVSKHGRAANDSRPDLWAAGLEALSSYPRVSGCCDLDSYLEYCMDQRLEQLRRERNERIARESPFSLDAPRPESRECWLDRLRGPVGDCSNFVALWDYAERLGARKNRILHQLDRGLDRQEIMAANHMTLEEYQALLSELQDDFLRYLAI